MNAVHSSDWGDIGMVIRCSEDNGKTWGDKVVISPIFEIILKLKTAAPSLLNIDMVLVQDPRQQRESSQFMICSEGRAVFGMCKKHLKAFMKRGDITFIKSCKQVESLVITVLVRMEKCIAQYQ